MINFGSPFRRPRQRSAGTDPRGQILLIFAFGLIVFIGLAALTIDVGSLYVARRNYQNATDAAALAGASYLTRPLGDPCAYSGSTSKPICARRAAWRYLDEQLNLGVASGTLDTYATSNTPAAGQSVAIPGAASYTIWVSTPPNGAGTAAAASTVASAQQVLFVRVDRQRDTFFGKIFAPQGFTVSAWSTAGIFPNRYAVITLRRGRGGSEIDPGPANTTDMTTAGTTTTLTVIDGDIGGNWGMKLTAGSLLKIYGTNGDDANAYLIDNVSCGQSCWSAAQVVDQSGNPKAVKKLPAFVPDPNYAPPPIPGATWPNGPVNNTAPALDIPNGDTSTAPFGGATPSITINAGSVNGSGQCVGLSGTAADAPKLGPGTYTDLTVPNNKCVILDPLNHHSNPGSLTDVATPIASTQAPDIFYFTGSIDIRNSALVYGSGVTVIIRPSGGGGPAQFSPGSGGVMDLNTDLYGPGTSQKLGAWTTKGASPYAYSGGAWAYQAGQEANPNQYGVGIALYVLKPGQAGISASGGTNIIQVSSAAALAWKGVTYAPNDNVTIAGQPHHDGIGQLISWTFTFNGGTGVTQTYDGPGDGFPYLIEPCVQVAGACQ